MKLWVKISLWVIGIVGIWYLLFLVNTFYENDILPEPDVKIYAEDENTFLNEEELIRQLHRKQLIFDKQTWDQLNTEEIEKYIKSISHVKDVNVYREIGHKWHIDIQLRKPIVRIFNKHGESFYLDEDGFVMNTTPNYTARVIVASGEIDEKINGLPLSKIINNDSLISIQKLDDIYQISNYVCNNPLFQSLIGQIYVEKGGEIVLTPLIGGQRILFGSANSEEEVKQKFNKLEIFYTNAMPYEGWETYKEIVLKYNGQIVGTKKE